MRRLSKGLLERSKEMIRAQSHQIGPADLGLELEDGFPKAAVLEEQSRLKLGFSEPQIGVDQHRVRIDVEAYRTRQQPWLLHAEKLSSRRHEDQLMGVVANCGLWQPLHEGLAVVSYALLDCDEKVALLLKAILEMLMVDDLHGLCLHAAPVCRSVSDDFGWKKFDCRQRPSERLRRESADSGSIGILM